MTHPRLLAAVLNDQTQRAVEHGDGCIPVAVRVKKKDGTLEDLDTTGVEFHANSGILYIIARE